MRTIIYSIVDCEKLFVVNSLQLVAEFLVTLGGVVAFAGTF